jgi:hypothetical protein
MYLPFITSDFHCIKARYLYQGNVSIRRVLRFRKRHIIKNACVSMHNYVSRTSFAKLLVEGPYKYCLLFVPLKLSLCVPQKRLRLSFNTFIHILVRNVLSNRPGLIKHSTKDDPMPFIALSHNSLLMHRKSVTYCIKLIIF